MRKTTVKKQTTLLGLLTACKCDGWIPAISFTLINNGTVNSPHGIDLPVLNVAELSANPIRMGVKL